MKIGYLQGRLCDQVDGKIQAFPWMDWEKEFALAEQLGLELMEWTLDQERLYENPLLTNDGRARIKELSARHGVKVVSLTGDCFMQAPFFKAKDEVRKSLTKDLHAVVNACIDFGMKYLLIPLVDNGHIQSDEQKNLLKEELMPLMPQLEECGMKILFESDFPASRLVKFIDEFPPSAFGINYDIGNSAALGYDPAEEIAAYGARINNVHVKDRMFHGTTVPLGEGNADFKEVFSALKKAEYRGDLILQTARAKDGRHQEVLAKYRDMALQWWANSGA